ncbi:GAF domain containing protein [Trichomonas vaginalis G3]|uniref:GAF domain containing protein n=1 Tax=Trichomonas vaginalis (strain ATCC PRA-98 / G3) TaxID=412133 RepID=A2DVK5_TRIV3|nr:3',5'-cyclic-nucleotide phosphodiesterase protein [Trichomonas vaginalis G3]EAY15547.1 GAF domain containing protein [Trichomonas vaginalis G3]KAI5526193.1 3',5'-cyclic-nucleotide phosphodiesterase protein [Trichomonas vaginalis G3]|eukprot:XP_001327770.1 GAF domain containing protein [Trichomonas vaginalis G3]
MRKSYNVEDPQKLLPVHYSSFHYKALYENPNETPPPVDQFAPLLSKKIVKAKIKYNTRGSSSQGFRSRAPFSPQNTIRSINTPNIIQNTGETPLGSLDEHIRCEDCFDKIISGSFDAPLAFLVETNFTTFFFAQRVHFFHDISSIQYLYGPTLGISVPYGSGLVGYCHYSKKLIRINVAEEHASYQPVYDKRLCNPESSIMLIPIFSANGSTSAIIEVVRNTPFGDEDEARAQYFQEKFKLYSKWILNPQLPDTAFSDFCLANRYGVFVDRTCQQLTKYFMCKIAELWQYNNQTHELFQLVPGLPTPQFVQTSDAGIVAHSLIHKVSVSADRSDKHAAFNAKTDIADQSILVLPVIGPTNAMTYGIALRGKRQPAFFTDSDEKLLARVSPIIFSSLAASEAIEESHKQVEASNVAQNRLKSLLDVAKSISCQLDIRELIPMIMNKACDLVCADRCSLFMVNETRDQLYTSFSGGLANSIYIPINAGIVGSCAMSQSILNIRDAYEDPRFNRNTDKQTGYRTKTLLCVPIIDDHGNIQGVTEMINKMDGHFSSDDEQMMEVFNVFCALSIENAKLYNASIELTMQLKSIMEISQTLTRTSEMHSVVDNILKDTRKVIGAGRALLYSVKGDNSTELLSLNEDVELKKKRESKRTDEQKNLTKRAMINEMMTGRKEKVTTNDEDDNEILDTMSKAILRRQSIILDSDDITKGTLACPILTRDRANVIGCLVMQCKLKGSLHFQKTDSDMIESFSIFMSIALEKMAQVQTSDATS